MKLTRTTTIHLLLGLAVLLAVALLYALVAGDAQPTLSPLDWLVFDAALGLVLLALALAFLRRRGSASRQVLCGADTGHYRIVGLLGCALAVAGVVSGTWWLMVLGIVLAPLFFLFRRAQA